MIDLARLLLGFCPSAFQTSGLKEKFIEGLFKSAEWNTPWTSPLSKTRETNTLLVFRSVANAFQDGAALNDSWLVKVSLVQCKDVF